MQIKVTLWRQITVMILAAIISGNVMAEPSTTPATASDKKSDPVIFWAHYMPMLPHGHQHSHSHNGGNLDSWPLNSQAASSIEDCKEDIRQALASGINGFQMLTYGAPEMCQAAKEIYQETGEMFYVAPEWCWSSSPKNTDDAIANIAAFALAHQDDPHVYKEKGRQVHFFYGGIPWKDNQALLDFKQKLAEKGANVLLAPTIYDFDRVALDQANLHGGSGDLPVLSATTRWLKETHLEAATGFDFGVRPAWGLALDQKLKQEAPDFFWVPALGSGYDSSNRPGQAIHCPFNGVRNLWDTFQFWMKLGYRKYSYITWNDCLESLLIPSSRNVWGYNTITRYFHDVIESGKSSFKTPQVVVSYPVDCMVGDQFFMQFLVLPAGNEKLEVRAAVELDPVGGGKKVVLRSEGASSPDSLPVFLEIRKGTGEWISSEAFRPVATVEIKNMSTGEWEKLYDRVRLGMMRMRYNVVQFPVNYAVNLDRVDSKTSLSFAIQKPGKGSTLCQGTVQASASSSIRRLMLMEGTMSLGAFRNVGDEGKDEKEEDAHIYRDLFIRLEVSEQLPVKLAIENGLIHDLYSPSPKLGEAVAPVNASSARFNSHKDSVTRTARVDLSKKSRINFSLDGKQGSDSLSVDLNDLRRGAVAKTIVLDGKKITLGMALTTDSTDPNIDYALPQQGKYKRDVPLYVKTYGVRVLQTMAWLQSGKVAYSNLSLLRDGSPSAREKTVAQWIETCGTFDDFIDGGSSVSLNPFTPGMVKSSSISKSKIPYFHLDFEEGAGARLNDHGTSHELGRAWFAYSTSGRKEGAGADYDLEKNGHYQWVEGVRGKGIQLAENTRVHFRSKSSPIGAETVSVWAHLSERKWDEQPLRSTFSVPPFKLELSSDRQGSASFNRAGIKVQVPPFKGLHPGWNHLVFCYDLGSVTVYLDGKQVALVPNVKPAYQRTHHIPYFGFSDKSSDNLGFDGQLDEVEVIGTGLDASEVEKLWQGKAWRDAK